MDRGSEVRKVKRGFTDRNAHLNKVDFIVVVGVQHYDQNLHLGLFIPTTPHPLFGEFNFY